MPSTPITLNHLATIISNRERQCRVIIDHSKELTTYASMLARVADDLAGRFSDNHPWRHHRSNLDAASGLITSTGDEATEYGPTIGTDLTSLEDCERSLDAMRQFDNALHTAALALACIRDRMVEQVGQTAFDSACIRVTCYPEPDHAPVMHKAEK